MPEPSAAPTQSPPRQRIINAAIACFIRDGFHGASMGQICAEANMSPGALYRYFPSKVSIIAAIAEAERQEHRHLFDRLDGADDPIEAIVSIGLDKLESLLKRPYAALAAEVMAEAARNPDVSGMFYQNQLEARSHLIAALERGQASGKVDPDLDVTTACQLIMAMGDGLNVHQGLDRTLTAARYRPVLEQLIRRFLRPPAKTAAIVALLLGLAAPLHAQTARPPAVTTVAATSGSIAETAILTGTLVPREEVLVSPQVEGLAITELLAEEGDRVAAGQVLARLSRDVLDATLAQNAANVARAEGAVAQARSAIAENQANLNQANLAFNRTRDLLAGGNASREVFEQRQAAQQMAAARLDANTSALRIAEAELALAGAQRQELLVRLARTDVTAPVAGVVSRRTARLGAVVAGAGDPLFRIIQDGAIELEADVPELLLAKLHPGQPVALDTASGPRTGAVRLVSPEVNHLTRLGRVRVAIDDGGQPLVIGSFARGGVETARRNGVLAPLSAILFQSGGAVVQVVRDGLVETRRVEIGLRHAGQVELRSGLAPGESIVAVSGTFVRGGDHVVAIPASASTQPASTQAAASR